MSAVDKDLLFKPRLPEDSFELPAVGTFRIRGLSRGEVLAAQRDDPTLAVFERRILARGVVDPPLTEVEVGRWQEASPSGEMEPLIAAIERLSGINRGADKEVYAQFREEPGPGVRALPGAEAGDDGGDTTGGDGG